MYSGNSGYIRCTYIYVSIILRDVKGDELTQFLITLTPQYIATAHTRKKTTIKIAIPPLGVISADCVAFVVCLRLILKDFVTVLDNFGIADAIFLG